MSGRKQKLKRKGTDRNLVLDQRIQMRKLNELPAIPADFVIPFLMNKFIGKTGYHYISISKPGSLFIHENFKNLVPVVLHHAFPNTTAMGRFNDPNQKDCVVSLVRVPPSFKGIILDRNGTFYSEGIKTPIPKSAQRMLICTIGRVSAQEYNDAVRSQEQIYCEKLEAFSKDMEERIKHLDALNPYDNPYDVVVDANPYDTTTEIPL